MVPGIGPREVLLWLISMFCGKLDCSPDKHRLSQFEDLDLLADHLNLEFNISLDKMISMLQSVAENTLAYTVPDDLSFF